MLWVTKQRMTRMTQSGPVNILQTDSAQRRASNMHKFLVVAYKAVVVDLIIDEYVDNSDRFMVRNNTAYSPSSMIAMVTPLPV